MFYSISVMRADHYREDLRGNKREDARGRCYRREDHVEVSDSKLKETLGLQNFLGQGS